MANQTTASQHVVGQTKAVGFQIGARRTFDVSPQHAWDVITSDAGLKLWLGDAPGFCLETGSFHQENLPGPKERRERQAFYAGVLDSLEKELNPD